MKETNSTDQKECEKDRDDLVTHRLESIILYEGLIITTNLGALGLSVNLYFRLQETGSARGQYMFCVACIFLFLSLIIALLTHFFSRNRFDKDIVLSDQLSDEGKSANEIYYIKHAKWEKDNKKNNFWNGLQLCLVIMGLSLLLHFFFLNI